ncbi:MAG TPA: hypothetical protein DCF33_08360 [Saprospirales bacterium]|nr:hypothetical protein [Saprospirales bacterium]
MRQHKILLFFFLLHGACIMAQNDSLPTKTLLRKMEFGIDAVPYIAGEVGASFLFKVRFRGPYFGPKRHRQTVVRSHLKSTSYYDGYSSIPFFNPATPDTSFQRHYYGRYQHLGLSLGIEQQFVRKRMGAYFGAEAFGFYKWTNGEYRTEADPTGPAPSFISESYDGSYAERAFGVAVLAGFRYFILRQLSIGLEAHFSGAFNFAESQSERNGVIIYDNNQLIEFRIQPIRVLYLSYHFGR